MVADCYACSRARPRHSSARDPKVRFDIEERRWPAEDEETVREEVFQLLRAKRASPMEAVVTIRQEGPELVVLVLDDPSTPYNPPSAPARFRSAMEERGGTVTEFDAAPYEAVEARLRVAPVQ